MNEMSMLTRVAMKCVGVGEAPAEYGAVVDYEREHRFAEHEHENGAEPEPDNAREWPIALKSNG